MVRQALSLRSRELPGGLHSTYLRTYQSNLAWATYLTLAQLPPEFPCSQSLELLIGFFGYHPSSSCRPDPGIFQGSVGWGQQYARIFRVIDALQVNGLSMTA